VIQNRGRVPLTSGPSPTYLLRWGRKPSPRRGAEGRATTPEQAIVYAMSDSVSR